MTSQKLNESFYRITGLIQELQDIKRMFTLKKPNAFFDPMIKRGLVPDSEVFYIEEPIINGTQSIILPTGLMPFVKRFGLETEYTPEYNAQEIISFIETLNMPFPLYDYQLDAVVDSIVNKTQLCLAATGCLDPQSKINVEISEEAYLELKEFRK